MTKPQRSLELILLEKAKVNPKVAFTVMARAYATNEALKGKAPLVWVCPYENNLIVGWPGKELELLMYCL